MTDYFFSLRHFLIFSKVKETLSQIEDSEEQMEALMRLMELRDEDLRQREEIARRIQVQESASPFLKKNVSSSFFVRLPFRPFIPNAKCTFLDLLLTD